MTQAKNDQETVYVRFLDDAIGSLVDHVQFGDFDNDVHPLFQQVAFTSSDVKGNVDEIEKHTYQAMLPALRLTSIFITEPAMLPVFDYIANGFVTGDSHGDLHVAKCSIEKTLLGHEYIRQIFLAINPNVLLNFTSDLSHKLAPKGHASTLVIEHANIAKRSCIQNPLHTPGRSTPRHIMSCLSMIPSREYFHT
jgi:hypothetical protein